MSQQTVLTTNDQKLNDSWEEHLRREFKAHSADDAIATMARSVLDRSIALNQLIHRANTARNIFAAPPNRAA